MGLNYNEEIDRDVFLKGACMKVPPEHYDNPERLSDSLF